MVDYRLACLLQSLIWFELFEIFEPQAVRLDLGALLGLRNFGVYGMYVAPCSRVAQDYAAMLSLHFGSRHLNERV